MLRTGLAISIRNIAASPAVEVGKGGRASKSLEVYMRRAMEKESMMNRERNEMERGKRHLANMMGMQGHEITQAQIDDAISYLFPSGLSDKKALAIMRPPDEVVPRFNKLSFDGEGRPAGTTFYTLKPAFYSLLSDIGRRTEKVSRFNAEHKGKKEELTVFGAGGSVWLSEEKMSKRLHEKITTNMYNQLITALEYLASLPSSYTQSDFLHSLREPIAAGTGNKLFDAKVPEVTIDPTTKRRSASSRAVVKRTEAEVKVVEGGNEITVDGQTLDTIQSLQAREVIVWPLIVSNTLGRVSVWCSTKGEGGDSAVPRSVRHALSLAIAALYPDKYEALRLSGLLTRDPRKKERSKVNQPGARAKWIWKRR